MSGKRQRKNNEGRRLKEDYGKKKGER